MSQHAAKAGNAGPSVGVHGDELLHQLQKGWRPLPNKTLFALAMGGLRVRLMRSVVTMLSVVLAIAFLTYTGLTNYLTFNVASGAKELLRFDSIEPAKVADAVEQLRKSNPFASMPVEQQRGVAADLGYGDTREAEVALITLPELVGKATAEFNDAEKALAEVEKDPGSLPVDKAAAKARFEVAKINRDALEKKRGELTDTVKFGTWVAKNTAGEAEAMAPRLRRELDAKYESLVGTLTIPGRLSETDWEQLDSLLALAAKDPAAAAQMPVVKTALEQERAKRSATDLRKLLQSNGIDVEKTLAGNPMDTWLIVMAMMTCAVGIANAMLMSVTERFREIGTMKCLGAQDNLVVKLFLLESAFLGVIGAAVGILLGIVVVVLAAWLQYGRFGMTYFPGIKQCFVVIAYAIAGGVILAVLGATGPAWQAARMRPVDALRVDE